MDRLVQQLHAASDADKTVFAIAIAEKIIEKGTKSSDVLLIYALNLVSHARFEEAVRLFNKVLEYCSEVQKPWILDHIAKVEMERGNFSRALEVWTEASELAPEEATFLIFAASTAFKLNRKEESVSLAKKATQCSKGHVEEAWFNLGSYYSVELDYEKAVICYKNALEIDPEYDEAILRLKELKEVLDFEKKEKV